MFFDKNKRNYDQLNLGYNAKTRKFSTKTPKKNQQKNWWLKHKNLDYSFVKSTFYIKISG